MRLPAQLSAGSPPPGRAEALVDRDSLNFAAPLAQLIVGAVSPLEQLLQTYQAGRRRALQ